MDFFNFFNNLPDKEPRTQQAEALSLLNQNWNKFRYFYLDAPVGVGKTYLGLSISDVLPKSYFLTSTKALQEQYEKHSNKIINLKGRGNYVCNVNMNFMVDAAPCAASPELLADCKRRSICSYYNQKNKALASQMMITNYAFFLYSVHCGVVSDTDENPWKIREALIMDEAHELESHLISFAELDLKISELYEHYGIGHDEWKFSDNESDNFHIITLIRTQIEAKIDDLKEKIKEVLVDGNWLERGKAKSIPKATAEKIKKLNSRLYTLDKILQRLKVFMEYRDAGLWVETPNIEENSIKLSPLSANFLFSEYLEGMANKFVFMSATLPPPEVLCKELGISLEEMCVIKVDTPFDPDKSPIISLPLAKLGYKDINASMPKVLEAVEAILEAHPDEKGIIHAGNYRITNDILKLINPSLKERLIARDMFDNMKMNNQKMLDMHYNDDKPTVLISPSMTTGVDLFDEFSRFQIIIKLPFLSLADPRIKKKSEMFNEWYTSQMWMQILQASGRSTRSEEDFSTTYILDASFPYFYQKSKNNLPKWFKDRVQ